MTVPQWRYVGVDWDSGSWVAVGYSEAGGPGVAVYDAIEALWDDHGATAERIVIDVPIGLCDDREEAVGGHLDADGELSRRCDDLARTVIGPRSSSVFTPPCRAAARAAVDKGASYQAVNETNRDHTGKGLMQQAVHIAPGIVAVEDLLEDKADPDTLVEGHPEVCFRAFADDDLSYNKATAQGMAERLDALAASTQYTHGTWRELAGRLADRPAVGTDDLVDALGLALTARADDETLQTLPDVDPVPTDAKGLPMQMVYRRSAPFFVE